MSRKHATPSKQVFTNFDMSGAGISIETDCEQLDRILYRLNWTGTPTGNISVQISDDKINWEGLPIDPVINTIGVADVATIDISNVTWKYIRLSYSFGGGVGTLNAFYKAHTQGA